MAQINIPSSGVWSSIASALNTMFSELFGITGWAQYNDSQYTSASPLVVGAGSTVRLPNNSATSIESQLPSGISSLYDGVKITPELSGDFYTARVSFTAFGSVNDSGFNVKLDISATGDGSIIIATIPVRMIKGSGSGNAQVYTVNFPYYSLGTFVSNGGTILLEAADGNISIYDTTYLIERTHKAR